MISLLGFLVGTSRAFCFWGCPVSKFPPTSAFSLAVVWWCGCPGHSVQLHTLPTCTSAFFFPCDSFGVRMANSSWMPSLLCGMGPRPGPVCSGLQFQWLRAFTTMGLFSVLSLSGNVWFSLEIRSPLSASFQDDIFIFTMRFVYLFIYFLKSYYQASLFIFHQETRQRK